ncbi:MAG TPA: ABC transporter permease [Micromonosporaceae bacterium]|nr:ABC transporter permease [Micromonosporaceae bacterium]
MSDASTRAAPSAEPPARAEREFTIKERTQVQIVLSRFLRHRAAVVSLVVLLLIILWAYLGQRVWPRPYDWLEGPGSAGPSLQYPMGTDEVGHDYFSRVMRGAQQSLNVAFLVALLSTAIGAPYGAVAGYFGGRVDMIMMRIVDVMLTLPVIAVAGMLTQFLRGTWWVVALILAGFGWVVNARVVRGVVLSLREQEFIEAARALGASDTRVIFRHLIPNVTGVLIVQATLDIAGAILAEAGLSFIGLGIQGPDTSLGLLTNLAQEAVGTRPWLFYFPGLTIIAIALTINFIGDGLRDALDPRQTRQRR